PPPSPPVPYPTLFRSTVRPRQEAVPVRPEPQDQVQEPRRSPAHAEGAQPAERPVEPGLAERAAAQPLGQLKHDLPVGELAFLPLDRKSTRLNSSHERN